MSQPSETKNRGPGLICAGVAGLVIIFMVFAYMAFSPSAPPSNANLKISKADVWTGTRRNYHHGPPKLPKVDETLASCIASCLRRNKKQPLISTAGETFPSEPCTDEWWCDSNFQSDKIQEVCQLFCHNQYPEDCATAKYLIVQGSHFAGFGSDLHIRMVAFTLALNTERVMVYSPDSVSLWTSPLDQNKQCAKGHFDCYFLPLTKCTDLPGKWSQSAQMIKGHYTEQSDVQFLMAGLHDRKIANLTEHSVPQVSSSRQALQDMPILWWKAQMAGFLFRPNAYMMSTVIWPKVKDTFGASTLPRTYISVFIRGGDKYKEAALHAPKEYYKVIETLYEKFSIRDIYVSSDSAADIRGIKELLASDSRLRMYYIDYPRLDHGLDMDHLREKWNTKEIRKLINVALTDLFIASHASAWIGTLSSNWCRLIDETRLSNGRYGSPYHSLDGVWIGTTPLHIESP